MRGIVLSALTVAALAPALAPAEDKAPAGKFVVYTTFYPTTYFVERIAGERVQVVNPCPPDADPAFWNPDAKTLEAYQKADLIVTNGADFEKWIDKASLPETKIVDTSRVFKDEYIVLKDAIKHSHGKGGEHTHEGVDGHTWVDPVNAKRQAQQIRDALIKRLPQHKDDFNHGFDGLAKDLDALDARLKTVSEKIKDLELLANHPAWNYVARRYGWKLQTFAIDPETLPSDEVLAKMKAYADEHKPKFMLWEEAPAEPVAAKLHNDFGLTHLVFAPCECLAPEDAKAGKDYIKLMNENIDRLGAMIPRG